MSPSCSRCKYGTPGFKLGAVLCEMGGARFQGEVRGIVIQGVPVPVVDNKSGRHRAVRGFPHDDRPGTPHVRVGDLHPCPRPLAALWTPPNPDGPDGRLVGGRYTKLELRRDGRPSSATADVGASAGAVIDCSTLSRLTVEGRPALRASKIGELSDRGSHGCDSTTSHGGTGTTLTDEVTA